MTMLKPTVTTLKPTVTSLEVVSEIFGRKTIKRVTGWNVAWCGHISLIKEK